MKKNLLLTAMIFLSSSLSSAEILFEGYYKIEIEGKHIGYSIIREEFDAKKKEFVSTRFTKTSPEIGDITMSTIATCDDGFKPKSLNFVYLDKSKKKLINGKVAGTKFILDISEGGAPKKSSMELPKGIFFSSFVSYLIMQKGIKTDTGFDYSAIAEETGTIADGTTKIDKVMVDYKNQKVFKAINTFGGSNFTALLNTNGETLVSDTPSQNEHAELVKTPDEATKGINIPKSVISNLFGGMPAGTKNSLNPDAKSPAPKSEVKTTKQNLPPKPGQKLEVPPGRGIIIKTQTKDLGK